MTFSIFQTYVCDTLARIPLVHWAIMGVVSLALIVVLIFLKTYSIYGSIALGIVTFIGLFLLDAAVIIRFCGAMPHDTGINTTLELNPLFHGHGTHQTEPFSNIIVFVPFGLFLSEFLFTLERFSMWHRLGLATLVAFSLSLYRMSPTTSTRGIFRVD